MTSPAESRRAGCILLGALAVAAFLVLWRAAGNPLDARDVYWLDLAVNGRPAEQPVEHGAHLVLVEAVVALAPGGVFGAARTASVFLLTATLVALAVAAAALRPATRGRAILAATFLFAAQTWVFTAAGSVRPELAAMAWVAIGLVISLPAESLASRRDYLTRAALLGAVTVVAVRSHPGGAILLWPALLLLRERDRWSPRRSVGRLGAWLLGAATAGLTVTVVLAVTSGRAPDAGPGLALGPDGTGWVELLWPGRAGSGSGHGSLRALTLLVTGAAIAAFTTERSFERRMLHLMPLVYVAALLVGRLFTGSALTPAVLPPILAPACLLGTELFFYAGVDRLDRREALTLPYLIPLAALAAVVFLIDPYLSGSLAPTRLLPGLDPVAAVDLARRTLAPGAALVLLIGASLLLGRPRMRLPMLLAAALLALGPGITASARHLAARSPAERAAAALWPWSRLADELAGDETPLVAVSPQLFASGAVLGPPGVLAALARLALGTATLDLTTDRRASKRAEYLLVTPEEAGARWREDPPLASLVGHEPRGRMVLLRSERPKRGADRQTTRDLRRRQRRQQRAEGKQPAVEPDQPH